jgi:hypothetical protein
VKTNTRAKNPMDTERREQEPVRRDTVDPRQPMPRQPEQQPGHGRPEQQPGHGRPEQQPEHPKPRMPEQEKPEQRPAQPRQSAARESQSRQPEPMEGRPEWPRERSDEEAIGRPVQLDDDPMEDLDEPESPTKGEPQRERRAAR